VKGRQKLLSDFGDLETLLTRAEEVPAKRAREALTSTAEARLSRELVTIRRDVPVELELERLAVAEPDRERCFRCYRARVSTPWFERSPALARQTRRSPRGGRAATGAGRAAVDRAVPAVVVTVVDAPARLPDVVARLRRADLVALDTVATSVRPRQAELVGLSLAASPSEVWYFPFGHRPQDGELAAPPPVRNLRRSPARNARPSQISCAILTSPRRDTT
jgi:DNA polymerase-1